MESTDDLSSNSSTEDQEIVIHKTKFVCSYPGCGMELSTKYNKKSHEMIHTGVTPFECNICDKKFIRKAGLIIHIRSHTGIKPFKCSHKDCNGAFSTSSILRCHKRTHTGEKPLGCRHNDCGRAFSNSSSRNVHERTHIGENAFKDKPKQSFKKCKSTKLLNHRYVYKGPTAFKCRHKGCDKSYVQNDTRKAHERSHLPNRGIPSRIKF
jgi:uncharacterized Zn-finger protein